MKNSWSLLSSFLEGLERTRKVLSDLERYWRSKLINTCLRSSFKSSLNGCCNSGVSEVKAAKLLWDACTSLERKSLINLISLGNSPSKDCLIVLESADAWVKCVFNKLKISCQKLRTIFRLSWAKSSTKFWPKSRFLTRIFCHVLAIDLFLLLFRKKSTRNYTIWMINP